MQFIDVRTDFAFKKVFGSLQSKDILISFLNALLDFGDNPIVNLTIVDPYQAPLVMTLKNTYVDIKAYLDNGTQVIIEMQVLNQSGFDKRVLSNVAKSYSTQLEKGDKYIELNPVIGLTFTDFVMFPQPQLASQVSTDFILLERHQLIPYSEDMRLVFVELPKFDKKIRELKGMTDKWIYFVKNVGHLKSIPKTLANDKAINQALTIANTASLTPEELDVQQKKLMWLSDQKTNLARAERAERENAKAQKAAQEALDKAIKAEAEKQAAEVEKQAALEQAKNAEKAAKLQIAKQMLQANADIAFIKQVTGLKKIEITKLKE
ncbi:MAG TPA: Rpn family recombination-promoting nuclease/putative transposase [Thioploca sp.]|nr:MAG: transposase [Gammaproteobacteria bacterium]HDN25775.1 Rpn family recombination-promoting nuclease/putative transposase [Thioploca sp.]